MAAAVGTVLPCPTPSPRKLHALPPSVASAGCLLGVMPQARKASEDGLEAAIDSYNKSVG